VTTYRAIVDSKTIKVAHVASVDMTVRAILLNQLLYLKERGYEIHAVCSRGPNKGDIEARGIPLWTVEIQRRISPLGDLRALWQLVRLFLRQRYTIVHTHTPKPGLLGQLAARIAGVPVVVNTVHGFYFHDHMNPWARSFYVTLEKIAALCSDRILSQNSEDVATAVREGICPDWKIDYLGNGIDLDVFNADTVTPDAVRQKKKSLGIAPQRKVVGFVGRLVRAKGYPEFLAAAARVKRVCPGTLFVAVGCIDAAKSDAVTPDIAQEYGVEEDVLFLGWRNDMAELYSIMDVLALPSHREGLPRSLMEASAMGIPIVATDVRGNREVVQHGRNGYLVPLHDVSALADAICDLLRDGSKARRMGDEGRLIAQERFDERCVFRHVEREYERLLAAEGLSGPTRTL